MLPLLLGGMPGNARCFRSSPGSLKTCCVAPRYELFIDDLPVWGFVGPPPEETKDDDNIYIYTHKAFDINYNDNRVGFIGHPGVGRISEIPHVANLTSHHAGAN